MQPSPTPRPRLEPDPGRNGAEYFLQRFALRPHDGYDPVAAMKFALEHQNPPVAGVVSGGTNTPLPAQKASLIRISDPGVLLWCLKPAEEGIANGVIARVWNVADAPTNVAITFVPGLAGACRTTHVETDCGPAEMSDGAVRISLARQELQTFRLYPEQSESASEQV